MGREPTYIVRAQAVLEKSSCDGWLIYDFQGKNRLALDAIGVPKDAHLTRRLFYWIPAKGSPVLIVHAVDAGQLELEGERFEYSSRQELEELVAKLLLGVRCVAMEYSIRGALPGLSNVDAGTVQFVREIGCEVVSSAQLLAHVTKRLSWEAEASHRRAAAAAVEIFESTWRYLAETASRGSCPTEWEVQDFILGEFAARGLLTEGRPICAVNAHSADPHYAPKEATATRIASGDFILLDLWCKETGEQAVFADLTQVGSLGPPTAHQQEAFKVVAAARDAAIALVKERFLAKKPVEGWEVDAAARQVVKSRGLEKYFTHRTGHNISSSVHGPGTHLDDFESHDERPLLPGCCFSIEPAVYFPGEFGLRLECDVLITEQGSVEVTGAPQSAIRTLNTTT